jgi:hypothetical protein
MGGISASSIFGALVALVVIAIIAGGISGMSLSHNDVMNPTTSDAQAYATKKAADAQAQKDAIDLDAYQAQKTNEINRAAFDLETYKAREAARLQADQNKLDLELKGRERELAQNLEFARVIRYTMLFTMTLALLIVIAGITFYVVQRRHQQLASTSPQVVHIDPWQNELWRDDQIRHARQVERAERESALIWRGAEKSKVGGNGRKPAEDKFSYADMAKAV